MRKGRSGDLFKNQAPKKYLVDTSAWANIKHKPNADEVFALIVKLIEDGRLFTCARVLGELRPDPIYSKVNKYRKALLAKDGRMGDVEFLQTVGKITHDHATLCKARSRKEPADPYVLAVALLEDYIVVADESTKRRSRKIPGACEKLGISCMTLDEFIAAEMGKGNGK